jgi:hypothetical protein
VVSDISATENTEVKSQGHGKTNKKTTSKNKQPEAKDSNLLSAARPNHSIMNNISQNAEKVDHEKMSTHKSAFDKEANGNSSHSGSENDVKIKVNEQAQGTNNAVNTDAKKPTLGSNTQNDTDKQAHGINSNLQNITKKIEQSINSANPSAEVTPPNAQVSLSANAERTPEADNYGDSKGNSLSSDSNSNTAPQPEHKSTAGARDPNVENQNDDNEDTNISNDENDDKIQDIQDVPSTSDAEDQKEDGLQLDHQGNFYTYCLIKNIFILSAFCIHTHTHTHTYIASLMLNVGYQLYILCTEAGPS